MLSVCRVGAKSSKSNRGLAGCSGLKKRRNYSQKPRNFFDVDSYEITEADKKKWKAIYEKVKEEEDKKAAAGKKFKKIRIDLDLEKEFNKKPWEEKEKRKQERKKKKDTELSPEDEAYSALEQEREASKETDFESEPEPVKFTRVKSQFELDLEAKLDEEYSGKFGTADKEEELLSQEEREAQRKYIENFDYEAALGPNKDKKLKPMKGFDDLLEDENLFKFYVDPENYSVEFQKKAKERREKEEEQKKDAEEKERRLKKRAKEIEAKEQTKDRFALEDEDDVTRKVPNFIKYRRDEKSTKPIGWDQDSLGDAERGDDDFFASSGDNPIENEIFAREREMFNEEDEPKEGEEDGEEGEEGDKPTRKVSKDDKKPKSAFWLKPAQTLIAKTRKHKILSNLVTIDFIEMITHSRRKREQKLRRKASVLRKYKAKKWKKYGAKIKASWARREERRKALNEERKTSNDWFYYPEINFWIHRRHLENDHIRRAIPVLLKNPSYTNVDKKKALDYMVKTVETAMNTSPEWYNKRAAYYQGIRNERSPTTIDRTADPDFKFPDTYEELIAKAEESMLPSDKAAKYAPSSFKKKEKQVQAY